MAQSDRLKEILGEPDGVLAYLSGGTMLVRVAPYKNDVAASTLINLKKGQYGRPEILDAVGRAYASELLERWGAEIEESIGARDQDAVAAWLVSEATGRKPRRRVALHAEQPQAAGVGIEAHRGDARPIRREVNFDEVEASAFRGMEKLSKRDRYRLMRMIETFVNETLGDEGGTETVE